MYIIYKRTIIVNIWTKQEIVGMKTHRSPTSQMSVPIPRPVFRRTHKCASTMGVSEFPPSTVCWMTFHDQFLKLYIYSCWVTCITDFAFRNSIIIAAGCYFTQFTEYDDVTTTKHYTKMSLFLCDRLCIKICATVINNTWQTYLCDFSLAGRGSFRCNMQQGPWQ